MAWRSLWRHWNEKKAWWRNYASTNLIITGSGIGMSPVQRWDSEECMSFGYSETKSAIFEAKCTLGKFKGLLYTHAIQDKTMIILKHKPSLVKVATDWWASGSCLVKHKPNLLSKSCKCLVCWLFETNPDRSNYETTFWRRFIGHMVEGEGQFIV